MSDTEASCDQVFIWLRNILAAPILLVELVHDNWFTLNPSWFWIDVYKAILLFQPAPIIIRHNRLQPLLQSHIRIEGIKWNPHMFFWWIEVLNKEPHILHGMRWPICDTIVFYKVFDLTTEILNCLISIIDHKAVGHWDEPFIGRSAACLGKMMGGPNGGVR